MKVIGMGNALVDIITSLKDDQLLKTLGLPKGSMTLVDFENLNFINVETSGLYKQKASGGSAANTIHGLAHLGIDTGFIGTVGNDELGSFFYKDMKSKKIDPILFKSIKDTGRSIALVSPDSERTLATYLGAAIELSDDDLNSKIFKGYDYFYVEGYLVQNYDLIKKALRLAQKTGLKTCIDLASFNIVEDHKAFFLEIIRDYIDIVFANSTEAEMLTGEKPETAVHTIGEMVDISVVKNGAEGSMILNNGKLYDVGVRPSKPVDTTGAGDMYASGFLYGLINNMPMDVCGQAGAIISGRVIEDYGAKMDEATWEILRREITAIMQKM